MPLMSREEVLIEATWLLFLVIQKTIPKDNLFFRYTSYVILDQDQDRLQQEQVSAGYRWWLTARLLLLTLTIMDQGQDQLQHVMSNHNDSSDSESGAANKDGAEI